ncbi:MAG: (Fe-S)-binding protein [Candidatus Thorarchaeota archaeon]
MSEEEAYRTVKRTLQAERITPYHKDEIEIVRSIEACINCGLCLSHCPVVCGVGVDRFSGPRSIAVELSRSPPEFWTTGDKVYLCTGCGTCREVCTKNVNIPEIVNIIRARIYQHRPDLVPEAFHTVVSNIEKHKLAFEPWEDSEEKAESRDMRLERLDLPYVPDHSGESADVLFYPGCQAEERAQEIKEAAKAILDHFDVSYAVLDEMVCCGLPAKLIGADETARSLNRDLKDIVTSRGITAVITSCAGCTSNLSDIAERDEWDIPVYHMIEYLTEEIGINRLSKSMERNTQRSAVNVTIHDPCHLIKHLSRHVMEQAKRILELIPEVTIAKSSAHDSCCGGGGMVGYHSPDVARSIVTENVTAIEKTGANRVVAPCPLCTAHLEENLYRAGSAIEVDDLTVFIAQKLLGEEVK